MLLNFCFTLIMFLFLFFLFHHLDLGLCLPLFLFWFKKSCKLNCLRAHDTNKMWFDNSMNHGHVLINNVFGSLNNRLCILKNFNCRIDKGGKIIMIYYVLHNFCQLMGMPKLMVQNVWQKMGTLVGFYGQHVFSYRKRNVVKEANEMMCNALFASWLKHYTLT